MVAPTPSRRGRARETGFAREPDGYEAFRAQDAATRRLLARQDLHWAGTEKPTVPAGERWPGPGPEPVGVPLLDEGARGFTAADARGAAKRGEPAMDVETTGAGGVMETRTDGGGCVEERIEFRGRLDRYREPDGSYAGRVGGR